jgi:hypothetical protein
LNLNTIAYVTTIDDVGLELEENMFGVGASIEESFRALVTKRIVFVSFLFYMWKSTNWWCVHEG